MRKFLILFFLSFLYLTGNCIENQILLLKQSKSDWKFNTGFELGFYFHDSKTNAVIENHLSFNTVLEIAYKNLFLIGSREITNTIVLKESLNFSNGSWNKDDNPNFYSTVLSTGYEFNFKKLYLKPSVGWKRTSLYLQDNESFVLHGLAIGMQIEKVFLTKKKSAFSAFMTNSFDLTDYSKTFNELGKFSYYTGLGLAFIF